MTTREELKEMEKEIIADRIDYNKAYWKKPLSPKVNRLAKQIQTNIKKYNRARFEEQVEIRTLNK